MHTRRTVLGAIATAGLAGCVSDGGRSTTSVDGDAPTPVAASEFWYTHPKPSGNRRLDGTGDLRAVDSVTFAPDGRPQWLVAHPGTDGSHWTVATTDGRVTHWTVEEGTATRADTTESIPPETQPVVGTDDGGASLVRPPDGMAARTSPLVYPGTDRETPKLLYVAGTGDLVLAGVTTTRLPLDALRDGRLAAVGDGRVALYGQPTDRYRHGALGDGIEGTTLFVVDADTAESVAQATLDPPAVFESLQPLVADLDDDGRPEIVTTVADSTDGARIAVFTPDGDRVATGPVHEPGWRHQLAVAPFGPDGRPELAVVRKPHVERVLEFYRLRNEALEIVATADGFASHTYGSRVLDGAVAADADADGRVELLVPTTGRDELAAVRRERGEATVRWRLSLDDTLRSNVTGVTVGDGRLAVGAASSNRVHVWQA